MLELAVDSVRLRVLGEGFMKRSMTLAAVLLCGAFTTPALAQSADDLAAKFGALEAVSQISLSPDGSKVAWISPRPGGGQVLLVANITEGGEAKAALVEPGGAETLSFCRWPTNDRLLCLIRGAVDDGTGRLVGFSRMFALNEQAKAKGMRPEALLIHLKAAWDVAGLTRGIAHRKDWYDHLVMHCLGEYYKPVPE